jgi:2-methylisocitrate lyase-like PEP mutase family enzyme
MEPQKRGLIAMTNTQNAHYLKAERFQALHAPGTPIMLYNIWDAGSAKAVVEAGAQAVATGSWSVAAAQGYADREQVPLALVEQIVRRIVATVDVPVSVDFEGAYAQTPDQVADNAARIMDLGVVGINFEDQIVNETGLYDIAQQCRRIEAIQRKAEALGIAFFLNARTDVFLKASDGVEHKSLLSEAKARAQAYAKAGASGFFAPGLFDEALIGELCAASPLPVNIMVQESTPSNRRLAELGVARISYGPRPFIAAMAHVREAARCAFAG